MQTVPLGNTDLHITRLGLGTWAMGEAAMSLDGEGRRMPIPLQPSIEHWI